MIFWIALISLFSHALTPDHAIYISVIEVRHIDNITSASVRVKVFSDDLHAAVKNAFGDVVDPLYERLCLTETERVKSYFRDHMQVIVNDLEAELVSTSCSFEGEAHWLEFSVQCAPHWKSLEIKADFLMEIFPVQTQMVHINENGENYTLRLTKSRPAKTIAFQN